jgi:hypothetical protein
MPTSCDNRLATSSNKVCIWLTYQLESPSCHDMLVDVGLPDMAISQRRIVLAMTGTRPMENINASAATKHVNENPSQSQMTLTSLFLVELHQRQQWQREE